MDPLSLTVSAITLIGASVKTIQGLEKLRRAFGAHEKVLQLCNEISDLRALFSVIHDTVSEHESSSINNTASRVVAQVLTRAQELLDALDAVVDQILVAPDIASLSSLKEQSLEAGTLRVSRRVWLRYEGKLGRLREDIRDVRQSLNVAISAFSSSEIPKIRLHLLELSLSTSNITAENRALYEKMDQHNAILNDLRSLLQQSNGQPPQGTSTLSNSPGSSTPVPEKQQIPPMTQELYGGNHSEKDTLCVKVSLPGKRRCSKLCSCQCHSTSHLKTPKLLFNALGGLFLGYTGIPMLNKKRCNRYGCKDSEGAKVQLSYYFPRWLVARMINVVVTNSAQFGPAMTLRVIRVLPDTSPVFTFARKGDIPSMGSFFQQGLASPIDVAAGDGRSALHMALYAGQSDMARFLIAQNADCEYEDKYFISAVGACWEMTFQNTPTLPPCIVGKSSDDDDFLSEFTAKREYNGLHKIVLGLANISVEQHLELSGEDVNSREASGRTALHWAAVRGDLVALETLINFGADCNALSNAHWSPLHSGSLSEEPEVLERLVKAGADIEEPNNRGDTSLSIVCLVHDDENFLNTLYRLGANINTTNARGETCLHRAALRDNIRTARWLIDRGIGINLADKLGCTAFQQCIRNNCERTLSILLEAGCYTDTRANNGRTILHDAAAYSNIDILTTLCEASLDYVNPTLLDSQDMNAEDVFNHVRHQFLEEDAAQRLESMRMFQKLLKAVEGAEPRLREPVSPIASEKGSDLDEFFDANELMESGQSSLISSVASLRRLETD
ncbi:ankyrin repeat-containing domain protein [Rhexocercosporidium sp. MPI-PUGE-AT-0058]|nr:ankyrin repeat-containing domain protein [Rhexocercosporidium sp. MPI-PUGE-AT-0058]